MRTWACNVPRGRMDTDRIVGWHVPGEPQPESRFFGPTDRCPHPERWTATDADSTEREAAELIGALVRALQPDLVVETGTAFGETTEQIVNALERNGRGYLFTLELEIEEERIAYVRGRIPESMRWELVITSSLEWVPPDGAVIDLLFSDTARDIRCEEVLRFLPWMRPGAIVAVHDSAWDMGPLRGWIENSIVRPGLGRAIDLPTPRGLTLLEMKPGNGE